MKTTAPAITYELQTSIAAAPDAVWRVLGDFGRDAEWREGVAMRSEPPGLARDGTRTFERLRMLGQTHEKIARIDRVRPGRSLRFRVEDGSVEGTRAVLAEGPGSRVVVTLRADVPRWLGLFAPLLSWLFRRRVERDLGRLRAVVTAARVPAITAPRTWRAA
jgi:hypothetical protein